MLHYPFHHPVGQGPAGMIPGRMCERLLLTSELEDRDNLFGTPCAPCSARPVLFQYLFVSNRRRGRHHRPPLVTQSRVAINAKRVAHGIHTIDFARHGLAMKTVVRICDGWGAALGEPFTGIN